MYMADKLSLLTGIGTMDGTCNSDRILVSQDNSAVTALMDLYSASAEERATVGCFFYFHEIGQPPIMIKNPLIDLLVQGH